MKNKTSLLLAAVLVCATALSSVRSASAQTEHSLYVRVAGDDEFAAQALYVYGYSDWRVLAYVITVQVAKYFKATFNIVWYSYMQDYIYWHSDDMTSAYGMLNETYNETGFTTDRYTILVALTGADIPGDWGCTFPEAELWKGVVLCELLWHPSYGQMTDNIIQHEVTHLYIGRHDDYDPYTDCVMNQYLVKDFWYGALPKALFTNNWCDFCKSRVNANIDAWGFPGSPGGGGSREIHPRGADLSA